MNSYSEHSKLVVRSKQLLYAMVITLVFEGILRKLVPSAISIIIFFVKDILCILGLYIILSNKLTGVPKRILSKIRIIIILMYPLLCYNLFFDPILFIWAAKLYFMYAIMAVLTTIAFPYRDINNFKRFIYFILVISIPTVMVGMLQLKLPPTHWLNRAVGGASLEGFSAGGILRVSSTFSFTGQYSFFLMFAGTIFFSNYFLITNSNSKKSNILLIIIGILLVIGCFTTGGRTAVFGVFVVFGIGVLITLKKSLFVIKKLIVPLLLLMFCLPLIRVLKPEYFAVFEKRSEGKGGSNEETLERILEPFTHLKKATFFGNGLGVMTNGVEKLSFYAANIRSSVWTETDFATIVWEGGFYLVLIWYGFRIYLIFYSIKLLSTIKNKNYFSAAAFLVAYIIVQAIVGTLTLQPPLAIYFWISFGLLNCIQQFDKARNFNLTI